MKIEKITIRYSTTIPIMQYGVNDKVDAEITAYEGELSEMIPKLKKEVDEIVHKMYPHLYPGKVLNNNHEAFRGVAEQAPYVPLYAKNFVPPPPPKPHEPVTEEVLRQCKTIQDLEWWFDAIDAKNGEERTALWNVYDEMFEKLNQTVITE